MERENSQSTQTIDNAKELLQLDSPLIYFLTATQSCRMLKTCISQKCVRNWHDAQVSTGLLVLPLLNAALPAQFAPPHCE
jgi:hypothetical protein